MIPPTTDHHFGRSFEGHRLEDECPCEKAACGLVSKVNPECMEHPMERIKTIRQSHLPQDCPKLGTVIAPEIGHAVEEFFMALDAIAQKHDLNSGQFVRHLDGQASDEAYEEWVQETWEPLTEEVTS